MSAISSVFSEILANNRIRNDFLGVWNPTTSKLHNDFMPPEVVVNSEDIAVLKAQIADQYAQITALNNYIAELKIFISAFKDVIYVESSTPGVELDYTYLL